MIDTLFLDALRAAIGTRHDLIGADDAQAVSLRAMFDTTLTIDATPCLPASHPVARREAWIHAGRPLDTMADDEWLDVETSIGLVVSMKPERVRQARCRLQVIADRERCTRDLRLERMLEVTFYHEHAEPYEYDLTSDHERARADAFCDRWSQATRGY